MKKEVWVVAGAIFLCPLPASAMLLYSSARIYSPSNAVSFEASGLYTNANLTYPTYRYFGVYNGTWNGGSRFFVGGLYVMGWWNGAFRTAPTFAMSVYD